MVITLYGVKQSPPVRSVLICAEALGLKVNFKDVDIMGGEHLKPAFLEINPQHTVPTITDGDFSIWDSHAINAYLVGKYAKDDSLYPKDLQKRAIVDQRLHLDTQIFLKGQHFAFAVFMGKELDKEFFEVTKNYYSLLETILENSKFMAGEKVTIADMGLITTLLCFGVLGKIDEKLYPKLTSWINVMKQQPFYQASVEGQEILEKFIASKLELAK